MRNFLARLEGSEEVPPVETEASGKTLFRLKDKKGLRFRLTVFDIRDATAAHIHLGERGENGPIVAFLYGPVDEGVTVEKAVVNGKIRKKDLVGPLEGESLKTLIREMEKGNTYVNVHTIQNPEGEIRGQIERIR